MPVTVCNYIRNTEEGGKFVVLRRRADSAREDGDDSRGIVVFSDFSQDFQHRDIVRRWERAMKKSVAEAALRVQGGGWWKRHEDTLIIFGRSEAYGRFDAEWLEAHLLPGMVGTESFILWR